MIHRLFLSFILLFTVIEFPASAQQKSVARLPTRWTPAVSADKAWKEYPRPQMTRSEWLNLNGIWDYAIRPRNEDCPAVYDGKILVPYPIESALSGVQKTVGPNHRLWYRKTFEIPAAWKGKRILLHCGAVDWEAVVRVNGRVVANHLGGYDPFTADITGALTGRGPQELTVGVWDPSDAGYQPRGKQVQRPEGIWYTPTTGIWQTVWLEPVPDVSISRLKMTPDVDRSLLRMIVECDGATPSGTVTVRVTDGGNKVAEASGKAGESFEILLRNPKLWTPDAPFLYDCEAALQVNGKQVDRVQGYFGMRKIGLGKDAEGRLRLCLNNTPLFQFGPLDQGFWPDGNYTAPHDEALKHDIEVTKQLGFNLARKHVKIEPDRWYYWCDRLGLLVWQDMPSGDRFISPRDKDIERTAQSSRQFETELKRLIDSKYNHPCIVMWVPFNEGWGQYDTERITDWIAKYDPSRLVNNTSGWADRGVGDVYDLHQYPGPDMPPLSVTRAAVLGEFGGLGLPLTGHTWQDQKNWGYRSYETRDQLTAAYLDLIEKLIPLRNRGLAAAIYTQTSDVEIEVNGLMTYDRALIKMDAERISAANRRLYGDPAK
jgi:beta-galactosidase/beta-glucuronidase